MKFRLSLENLKVRDVDSGFMSRSYKFALFNTESRYFHCLVFSWGIFNVVIRWWPWTLCLTVSVTRHLVTTSLEQHWRHTFSPVIRTCSALKASCMITYLLDETGSYNFTDASISTLLATENDI